MWCFETHSDMNGTVNCALCLDLTTLFKCKLKCSDVSPAQIAEGKDEKGAPTYTTAGCLLWKLQHERRKNLFLLRSRSLGSGGLLEPVCRVQLVFPSLICTSLNNALVVNGTSN